ncbi:MAG: hypothetical protein C4525_02400 [Desulfarculus sp.]|nr:MAG: hypothetical protein C4525_02400 [Desulfarculus sp.]
MNRIFCLALILTMLFLGLGCSGGGGGSSDSGSSSGNSLVGTWQRTSATNSPSSATRITFSGNSSGGTVQATQLNGVIVTGQWSLSGSTLVITPNGGGASSSSTVQFVDANNLRLIDSDGTSTWRRS